MRTLGLVTICCQDLEELQSRYFDLAINNECLDSYLSAVVDIVGELEARGRGWIVMAPASRSLRGVDEAARILPESAIQFDVDMCEYDSAAKRAVRFFTNFARLRCLRARCDRQARNHHHRGSQTLGSAHH